jgi:hypothetical protein
MSIGQAKAYGANLPPGTPFQSFVRTIVESMNKRLISHLMHERISGLRSSKAYFFRGDFEHVLRGVVFDYVPRGLYIEDFRFPLFDFGGPNLLYSDRLPERAFIGKGEMSEEAIVDFVMATPEAQNALSPGLPMGVSEFVHFLENGRLRNPHARLIHAAAFVLLGQDSHAADLLNGLSPILHPSDIPHFERLQTSLKQGSETAQMLLGQVRQDNLRAFDVV